ncbi:hypothetical protein BC629DRAFT_217819 [Irpex lacteus]|nr:hypothetical protein BC629DRAFT_217819 [Irpex lacteus]
MRSGDAQEAALGLLGLIGNRDFSTSKPTTTSTTATTPGISSSSSLSSTATGIPGLKRKTLNSAAATLTRPLSSHSHHSQPRSLAILLNNDDPEPELQHPPPPSRSQPVVHLELSSGSTTTPNTSTSTSSKGTTNNTNASSSDGIDCVCGFTYDDGFSVACDSCGTWVHAACFDIQHGNVPEIFKCWKCDSRRWDVDKLKERAVRLQKAQQAREKDLGMMGGRGEGEGDGGGVGGAGGGGGGGGRKRVSSPGVDRKRRVSATAMDQGGGGPSTKRRRRLSTGTSSHSQHPSSHSQSHHQAQNPHPPSTNGGSGGGGGGGTSVGEEEHVEIDEPASHSYVHTDKDYIPHQHTRDRLKLLAQHWRGVTALDSPSLNTSTAPVYLTPSDLSSSTPSKTSLHPLPHPSHSALSVHSAPMSTLVRPPSYLVRTTQPIPSSSYIAPYTSTIIPSTVYLSDPLNGYAHAGMPRPFVHLLGPPVDVALDARLTGNGTRFVRSGCRPNAVVRPVLCASARRASSGGRPSEGGRRHDEENRRHDEENRRHDEENRRHDEEEEKGQERKGEEEGKEEEEEETLTFGVFALRDLKAQEEVVLGWEWDDGSVIHHLPALIDSPHLFTSKVRTVPPPNDLDAPCPLLDIYDLRMRRTRTRLCP